MAAPLQNPDLKSIFPLQLSAWTHCLNTYTGHPVCGPKKERVLSTLSACKHKQTLHSLLLKDTSCWVAAGIQPRGNHLPLLSKIYSCLHLQIFYPLTGIKITKRSSEFSRDQSSQPSMPEDKASLIYDLWNTGAPQNPLSHLPPPSHTHTIPWSYSMTSRRLIYLSKSLLGSVKPQSSGRARKPHSLEQRWEEGEE